MTEATEHAILNAARSVQRLAEDLRGTTDAGTLGATLRNTLRAISGAATSIDALAGDLRGYHGSGGGTTGEHLRDALKRIGSKS